MTFRLDPCRVRELFDIVVELAPEERRQYLAEHCPEPALRHEVERLVAADTSVHQEWSADVTRAGALPCPNPEQPADLPQLELLSLISAGGMGVVWRVRDTQFERILAVKVLKSALCDDANAVRRFLAEAQITGQLAHPSIVPVHALGRLPDGRPYYTMKLVQGRTLADLLQDRPEPAARRMEFVQVFAQVCQAVSFAHSRGIIHRDLKPANIMVGAHGEVQVMDWGLAKVLTSPATSSAETACAKGTLDETRHEIEDQTAPGSVLGTWAYMPPEQARGQVAEVDRRSDVFGLGAILCEILTGQPPYVGLTTYDARSQARGGELRGAYARLEACGADSVLLALTRACLAAESSKRPSDACAVADQLLAYLASVQERLRQAQLERTAALARADEARTRVRVERRARWILGGLAAAGLVLDAMAVSTAKWFADVIAWFAAAGLLLVLGGCIVVGVVSKQGSERTRQLEPTGHGLLKDE
jgi:serine/threonine-protein kinase